jgi:amidase
VATVSDDLIRLYTSSDGVALGEHVRRKDISAAEAVEAAIVVIERLNPQLNAVIHRLYDMARAQVPNVPPEAPFAGVPFLLKELASMWRGAPLTNSCAWLKDARAPQDSEATRRTKAAGFVLVGKSNAPENGWAITSEPKLYGATTTPGALTSRLAAPRAAQRPPWPPAWFRWPRQATEPGRSGFRPHVAGSLG